MGCECHFERGIVYICLYTKKHPPTSTRFYGGMVVWNVLFGVCLFHEESQFKHHIIAFFCGLIIVWDIIQFRTAISIVCVYCVNIYIYIYYLFTYTHTHNHTHIYIYWYIVYVCIYIICILAIFLNESCTLKIAVFPEAASTPTTWTTWTFGTLVHLEILRSRCYYMGMGQNPGT